MQRTAPAHASLSSRARPEFATPAIRTGSLQCFRLFGWTNETLHNGGNYILEVALHEYLLQVRDTLTSGFCSSPDGSRVGSSISETLLGVASSQRSGWYAAAAQLTAPLFPCRDVRVHMARIEHIAYASGR